MPDLPEIILKLAISVNGYIDDDSSNRLILSSAEDLVAVDALRAESDAILVGAQTIRSDNPSLRVKNQQLVEQRLTEGKNAQPIRICLSRKSELSLDAKFFDHESEEKIIITETSNKLTDLANLQLFYLDSENSLTDILAKLKKQRINRILVEGGSSTFNTFFKDNLFDKIRIAIAPVFVSKGTRLNIDIDSLQKLRLTKRESFADTTVIWLEK